MTSNPSLVRELTEKLIAGAYMPATKYPETIPLPRKPYRNDLDKATSAELLEYAQLLRTYEEAMIEYNNRAQVFRDEVVAYNTEAQILRDKFKVDCIAAVFGSELPLLANALYDYATSLEDNAFLKDLINDLMITFLPIYEAALQDKSVKQR